MNDTIESRRGARWVLLIHHLPPEPAYLRVKVRRRLERLGAVPVKSSVYALPTSDDALEDLRWLLQEIVREGGDGSVAEATFVDGHTHARLVERCRASSRAAYLELAHEASDLEGAIADEREDGCNDAAVVARARKLQSRLEEVKQSDFFGAEGRDVADRAVGHVVQATLEKKRSIDGPMPFRATSVASGRTWVTRRGVKVDRIASTWLIRRFIDPRARFLFVDPDAFAHEPDTLRFDMFEGEFTHEGDRCTFETLLARFGLADPGLRALAEIVHDIDCKDGKFGRPETPGVGALVDGIVRAHTDDRTRIERGSELLDALFEHFRAGLP